jgi:hypothetical protein
MVGRRTIGCRAAGHKMTLLSDGSSTDESLWTKVGRTKVDDASSEAMVLQSAHELRGDG